MEEQFEGKRLSCEGIYMKSVIEAFKASQNTPVVDDKEEVLIEDIGPDWEEDSISKRDISRELPETVGCQKKY